MMKLPVLALGIFTLAITFTACGEKNVEGFEKIEDGYWVRLEQKGNETRLAKYGKAIILDCKLYNHQDSLVNIPVIGKSFEMEMLIDSTDQEKFSLMKSIRLMAEGDSVIIRMNTEHLLSQKKYFGFLRAWPETLDSGKTATLHTRVIKIFSANEYAEYQHQKLIGEKALAEQFLKNYLEMNEITAAPIGNVYVIPMEKGKGKSPKFGQKVKIHISGGAMGMEPVINTYTGGGAIDVELGISNTIPSGVTEAISYMKPGEKSTVIVPYYAGYGEKSFGTIPAYSNLVYEVELLGIIQ